MEIKQHDIVEYEGENYRVRRVDLSDNTIRLCGHDWVSISDVTLTIPISFMITGFVLITLKELVTMISFRNYALT